MKGWVDFNRKEFLAPGSGFIFTFIAYSNPKRLKKLVISHHNHVVRHSSSWLGQSLHSETQAYSKSY